MRIFLSGLMGSGKSTVARALGELARLPVLDLDETIANAAGLSVPEIFASQGEAAFRALERSTLHGLIAQHASCVIALGGGAVTHRELRRQLLEAGLLVTLDADPKELARRVGRGEGRPLLAGEDVAAKLAALRQTRADAYAECHLRVDTTGRTPAELAALIVEDASTPPIVVPLGTRSYRVEVGAGVRAQLAARIAATAKTASVLVVSDTTVAELWARGITSTLREQQANVHSVEIPPGEAHKDLASVNVLWNAALDHNLDRSSMLIGVGGGVVGDLTGFAAATIKRGVRVGHVPTTLLAMVDSAIGGKTGFDTRHGKNLIGAIHQPSFVLSDVEMLTTLPEVERRAGLAEVVKSAWIDGEAAVAQLEADCEALSVGEHEATVRAIRMAAGLKARVVGRDEHETGERALLNLGHTLGHAIETHLGYSSDMRHGQAVALGMVAAFRVAERLGGQSGGQSGGQADASQTARAVRLLSRLGLPVDVERYLKPEVFAFMNADKKRIGDKVAYIVPFAPGRVERVSMGLPELTQLLAAG